MCGLIAGYWQWLLPVLALLPAIIMVLLGRAGIVSLGGLIVIGLLLGSSRGTAYATRVELYDQLIDQKVTLQVQAAEDAVYGKGGQLKFVANRVVVVETGQRLPGKLGISGYGPNMVLQNDTLIIVGKLRKGIGSYQGFMSYAQLESVATQPSLLLDLRRTFGAGMLSALPEPAASFAMGILIGQRAALPEYVEDNLQMVGLTHIIAVSGANLTIMLEAARRLLGKSSKRLATIGSLAFMLTFVAMTGGSASIVRAAYVSGISVIAAYYGRRANPLLLISVVAAFTAYVDPIYIWHDAAWYLSFLAFFGVLMVSPLLQSRLPRVFQTNILLAIALESLCAEIMALPYVLYTFGEMSRVGLLANVLVVSVIPFAMLASFIAGLAGTFLWPIAGWFCWPAKWLLTYMLDTSNWIARWPGAFSESVHLSLQSTLVIYASLAVLVALLRFKDAAKSAIITDNEAINPYKNLGRTT